MRRHATAIGLLVSVLALGGVVWWASHQESPRLPHGSEQWLALAGAVVLYAVNTVIRGERWRMLLAQQGGAPSRLDIHALNVVGYAANNLLPARAGDALRVVLMAPRAALGRRAVIGTLVAERILDVAVLVSLFVVVGYALLGEVSGGDARLAAGVFALALVAALAALLLVRRNQRLHALFAPVLASTLALRGHHGGRLLAVTALVWAVESAVWAAAGAAVGLQMTPIEALYLVALSSVFTLIPSGPGYAGTLESAAIIGAKAIGASSRTALSFVISLRFVLVVPITLAGLVLLGVRYGGLRLLRARPVG